MFTYLINIKYKYLGEWNNFIWDVGSFIRQGFVLHVTATVTTFTKDVSQEIVKSGSI